MMSLCSVFILSSYGYRGVTVVLLSRAFTMLLSPSKYQSVDEGYRQIS